MQELGSRGLKWASAKKQRGKNVSFVHFDTTEDRQRAWDALKGAKFKSKHVEVRPAKSRFAGPAAHGHRTAAEAAAGCAGRDVRDSVTPQWRTPYEEQLKAKGETLAAHLKRLTRRVRRECSKQRERARYPAWTTRCRERQGMAVVPEAPRASPSTRGYRNKLEFSIGLGVDCQPVVGFQIGAFRDGLVAVAPGDDALNVPRAALKMASAVQRFVRESPLPVWDRLKSEGVWRELQVREAHGHEPPDSRSGEAVCSQLMAVVQVSPQCAAALGKEAELKVELVRLGECLAAAAREHAIPLKCAAWWLNDGCSNVPKPGAPITPLVLPGIEQEGGTRIFEKVSPER